MKNKNLDKLFQDQLKNLEVTPDKKVWGNIESKLKKKKRRVVPLWWFAGGAAAMLLLGMLLFPVSTDETDFIKIDSKTIVTERTENKVEKNDLPKIDSLIQNTKIEEKILVADKKTKESIKSVKKDVEKPRFQKKLVRDKNVVEKTLLANNTTKETLDSVNDKKIDINKNKQVFSEEKEKIVENVAIEKELPKNKVDLNKFIKDKDSVFSIKHLKHKWSIAPVFAVLNSNSFSNSSPVNRSLANSTKGKNSFSYGFQVGYQINKKWSIQSGIHLQEMSFVNNQVTAVSSISKSTSPVAFNSGVSLSFNTAPVQTSDFDNSAMISRTSLNGDLNQIFGYIEVPIEVKYNFLTVKNFNTQVVAGFSSLFLNKNEVNFSSQFFTNSGSANNLNNINFSGNLGFDFNYFLNNKWSLNLNPMFKAQLDTFSEDSNGFSPFNFGIYSGIKYTF
ncbi:PorT family protein [Polaribacter undariae]|uniref:PorT family protein n=2 Tax=Polaribacter sejongensis TaxID=985043 RepID=A0AAJ1QV14_9FLAO|nr:PorT family protein [Polaribacter undariae]MDN3618331.1 PorT family protein [Polaribacter undariae]UWD30684.1 PorT family protein [Polaribacter undariae]